MRNRRLSWLLVLMVVLAVARWLFPPRTEHSTAAAGAVVRSVSAVALGASSPVRMLAPSSEMPPEVNEPDIPGDAFAVRAPPAPPPAPPHPTIQVVVQATPPPPTPLVVVAPPPPPPPLQVIGTWDDGQGLAVFVSSPNGTLLARTGTMLLAEYRVTAITLQNLSLLHVASKREISLPVPRGAGP